MSARAHLQVLALALAGALGSAAAVAGQEATAAAEATADEARAPLTLGAYRESLAQLAAALRAGEVDDAGGRARRLLASRVVFGSETIVPDPSILQPIAEASDPAEAPRHAVRVEKLARALEGAAGDAPVEADLARLERLRRDEQQKPIEKGGDVGTLSGRPLTVPERILATLRPIWDWIGDAMHKFWRWLKKLWPRPKRGAGMGSLELNLAVMLLVAVVTAIVAVLAYRALRRSRSGVFETASVPQASSSRDEDPLSRGANEWETYAQQLASRGRRREAIRAWYHAVLVTLFRAGTLHYHKGRTNWEYVSRVPPEATWRATFVDMTRAFDREWYGRDTSTAETLRECAAGARRILGAVRGAEAMA